MVESKGLIQQPALGEFPTNWNDEAHPDLKSHRRKHFIRIWLVIIIKTKQRIIRKKQEEGRRKKDDYKKEAEKRKAKKKGQANSNSVAGMANRPSQVWKSHRGDSQQLGNGTEKSTNQKKALSNSTSIMNKDV